MNLNQRFIQQHFTRRVRLVAAGPAIAGLRLLLCAIILLSLASMTTAAPVSVEICEQGLADQDAWPPQAPVAAEQFQIPAFALDALPHKYVADGVRGLRPSPSLLRFSGEVVLPAGKHRVLLRSRSAARLWLGGTLVVETPFPPKNGGDGSQHDTERKEPLDLGPGFRFAPGGEYERVGGFVATGGPVTVKLEAFVGGREGKKPRRVELGETVVAVAMEGSVEWQVMAPDGGGFRYDNAGWKAYQKRILADLAERDAAARAALRAGQDAAWRQRRTDAAAWLDATEEVSPPDLPGTSSADNIVDRFIESRFAAVKSQNTHDATAKVDFFRDIKPLLESRCVECHRGEEPKGGLRLDDPLAAKKGGDSGPGIMPGNAGASELLSRVTAQDEDEVMPPKGARLTAEETAMLEQWISTGAAWPEMPLARHTFTPAADDLTFLRRVTLDTLGLVPTAAEARAFLADGSPDKRRRVIDRLLADGRTADAWMPLWQDLLAENPNILNPTLNNSGPFRWWLYESLQDDVPLDRMVTQLITQQGSAAAGGPAGFGLASQNDAPFAAKGTIVGAAFLGVEMKCARCHDSPSGSAKQEQLFQLGAMLAAKPLEVPKTSSVDPAKLHAGGRKALIEVTLPPGSVVQPAWPFPSFAQVPRNVAALTPREALAAMLTAPENERFAQVLANRVWAKFMGRGIVEPLDDWEKGQPTHPELLRWLGRELVRNGYQWKPLARLILNSAAYQRAADSMLRTADPLYAAPGPRRLPAEQVVDSLFAATGLDLPDEPLCLDLNGRREVDNSVHLGTPKRAWMLASLSNERDRPSLTLPRLQALTDVMEALGWRGARQDPASTRATDPNALQPAILANGVMTGWLTRLSETHGLTAVAYDAGSPETLVDELFLRLLTRFPDAAEKAALAAHLTLGFNERRIPEAVSPPLPHAAPRFVTWTNHLLPESNTAKQEDAAAARMGGPPTARLQPAWRARCEDVLWSIINSPEILYRP